MEEQNARLVDKVQALSDIELAVLLCLMTDQHCVVEADPLLLPAVEQELQIVYCLDTHLWNVILTRLGCFPGIRSYLLGPHLLRGNDFG